MNQHVGTAALERKRDAIVARTLHWWDRARRALAWRAEPGETVDPYRVWLSEVLLQQTTAQAVTPYFRTFVARWPTVDALAAAPIEAVISAFAGLGYYSRARNLHACAREIARRGGRFPSDEAALRALPGVGAYTAAAIAAIAFDRQAAPVDGNIARIVARLIRLETPIAESRKTIAAAARALAPPRRAGDFAQALMDIGATICRPGARTARLARSRPIAGRSGRARRRPIRARPPRRRGRSGGAPSSSPSGRTAPSSPGAGRRRGCSPRPSSCRAAHGRRKGRAVSRPTRRRWRRAGVSCPAPSSRSSPISP